MLQLAFRKEVFDFQSRGFERGKPLVLVVVFLQDLDFVLDVSEAVGGLLIGVDYLVVFVQNKNPNNLIPESPNKMVPPR